MEGSDSDTEQRGANCILGRDYPEPIIDYEKVSKENFVKIARALEEQFQAQN